MGETTTRDRTVHAITSGGKEVVRYERSGKWRVEGRGGKSVALTLRAAVDLATAPGATVYLGLPGGRHFDAAVQKGVEASHAA